jgi:radical SAM superfamily enzyme YgiQ (UPF0313 family)
MGGAHPTFFPEVLNHPALDLICRGEGEVPLATLLDRIEQGRPYHDVPGLWAKADGKVIENPLADLIADLDSLPFPARDLLDREDPWFKRSAMRRVLTGRGCPHQCSYCFNQSLREMLNGKGPYVRLRGVDHVMAELKTIAAEGAKTVNFTDDTFGLKRSWALELLDRHRAEIKLPFIVNLRPEQVDAELARALKNAGCHCAQIGVESASPQLRRDLLGRETTDLELESAARLIKESGIRLLTYNMVGLPGETLEQAAATLEWNARLKVDFPRVSIFQPYPRTAIGERILAENEAARASLAPGRIGESYFRNSPLQGDSFRRIENLHKLFLPYLKLPAARPALRALTRLPGNPIFDLVFLASLGLQYRAATNRTWSETAVLGLRNLRAYFS